jgi:hypothetical protein
LFLQKTYPLLKEGGRIGLADIILARRELSTFHQVCFGVVSRMIDIPAANMVTPEEYKQMLESVGYENIKIDCIEDDVFPGLTEFIERHRKKFGMLLEGNAKWLKFEVTRWALQYIYREKLLHFVIVTASKPSVER